MNVLYSRSLFETQKMLYTFWHYDYSEKMDESVSLQNQVKALRLKDKLGKENFHDDMKKFLNSSLNLFKIHDVSEQVTGTFTESSKENNKTLSNLQNRLSDIMNDSGTLAFYLLFPLSKITKPDHTSHFKLVKDSDSNRVNYFLLNKTIPVILFDNCWLLVIQIKASSYKQIFWKW